ncbi:MAG TPA: hypothetical protein VFU88_09805 [Ktedonobacterales bacterium]|nr:hypothetical protein [Ktedonobacterales bacterium]
MQSETTGEVKVDADAWEWFEREGLLRYAVTADETGEVIEDVRPPLVALGPRDGDFSIAPSPDRLGWPGKPLAEMSMDDYNVFLYRWLEAAVAAGAVRCANCGKRIINGEDLPDPETWDAILIEKELVAWMVVHFDCKKWLAKKIKGMHPFDLSPRLPPEYDLSGAELPAASSALPPEADAADDGIEGA